MDDPVPGSRRGAIAAIILLVLLVVGGLWLEQHLRAMSQLQDCVMQGRRNCQPVDGARTP